MKLIFLFLILIYSLVRNIKSSLIQVVIYNYNDEILAKGRIHHLRRAYSLKRLVCGDEKLCDPNYACCIDKEGKLGCCKRENYQTQPINRL